jgi:uncharacterized protein YbjT (DUF2867 family)
LTCRRLSVPDNSLQTRAAHLVTKHRRTAYDQALVLGATGGIGGEPAAALLRSGWKVVAMTRNQDLGSGRPEAGSLGRPIRVAGDATNASDVRRAAEGAPAIIHAVNPPGYRNRGARRVRKKLNLHFLSQTVGSPAGLEQECPTPLHPASWSASVRGGSTLVE